MVPTASERVLASLHALRAGERLFAALPGLTGVHLVGGAVRDLLLGGEPHELDLVAADDGPGAAGELARRLGGTVRVHEPFGTAEVELSDGTRIDVATARAETYPSPGALPVVRAAGLEQDLRRRDFTVNALAVGLTEDVRGTLTAFPGALEDLEARRLRVLHDGSFADDPTRLIRLARYGTRLGLVLDPRTEQLARAAFAAGAPGTVSASRWGAELWLLLGEPSAVAGLALSADLADGPIPGPEGGGLRVDGEVLRAVRALVPPPASVEHALLGALTAHLAAEARRAWLEAAHVPRPSVVADAASDPAGLAAAMRGAPAPSALAAVVRHRPVEAVAVAGAYGAAEAARRWLDDLRHIRLDIGGDDLLAAGVPRGPEVGRRLDAALAAKLDGDAATREDQLAAALADRP